MLENIKKWYINLPDHASGKFQLDKQIIKSTKENILLSISLTLISVGVSFLNNSFDYSIFIVSLSVFVKDIIRILIKFLKDYTE